jgi:hypothetical protein
MVATQIGKASTLDVVLNWTSEVERMLEGGR